MTRKPGKPPVVTDNNGMPHQPGAPEEQNLPDPVGLPAQSSASRTGITQKPASPTRDKTHKGRART